MTFLLGRHAMFGHDPPIYLRSSTTTRCPSPANVQAASVAPVPSPRISTSYSSGCASSTPGKDPAAAVALAMIESLLKSLCTNPRRKPLCCQIVANWSRAQPDRGAAGLTAECRMSVPRGSPPFNWGEHGPNGRLSKPWRITGDASCLRRHQSQRGRSSDVQDAGLPHLHRVYHQNAVLPRSHCIERLAVVSSYGAPKGLRSLDRAELLPSVGVKHAKFVRHRVTRSQIRRATVIQVKTIVVGAVVIPVVPKIDLAAIGRARPSGGRNAVGQIRMCQGLGKFLRRGIHLNNSTVPANDRYFLRVGIFNSLRGSDSPLPWKFDGQILQLVGISVHTNQPHPIRPGTEKIELLRAAVSNKTARAAVPQVHALRQKIAAPRVEPGQQKRVLVCRLGRKHQDSQRSTVAGNRHR